MTVYLYDVAVSDFGRYPDRRIEDLIADVLLELKTADHPEPDAVIAGTVFGSRPNILRALSFVGWSGLPLILIDNACASGTTALHEAAQAIEHGRFDTVLVVGFEQLSAQPPGPLQRPPEDPGTQSGLTLPGLYAMSAHRYMARYGASAEDIASVAVKNFGNAALNPKAHRRRTVSLSEVLDSPMVATPLTKLQCAPRSDGAAAALLGRRRCGAGDLVVRGSALLGGTAWGAGERLWTAKLVGDTTAAACEAADVELSEIDCFEVHDAFTIGEIVCIEAMGLVEEGTGAVATRTGLTAISGKRPVNTSGGLLGRGHALGATGLAQVDEIARQLRGVAGARQLRDCDVGLVETSGGSTSGIDGDSCCVVVLARQGVGR